MEIFYKKNQLIIQNTSKKEVVFDIDSKEVFIDSFSISAQWEYEKWEILAVVKKHNDSLFYNIHLDWYKIVIVPTDVFDFSEEFLSFFGDIDLLILPWSKNSIKIYENLEAKIVLPFWEWKDIFLNSISHNKEEVENYKIRWEILWDTTEFINLKV